MNESVIGGIAAVLAGHDFGKPYVIYREDSEYVYLVDGKIRTLDRPKKKKKKHVRMLTGADRELADKICNNSIRNEEIKRAIKCCKCLKRNKGGEILLESKED